MHLTMTYKVLAGTRSKLLDAARDAIRGQGYAATTVDDICARALHVGAPARRGLVRLIEPGEIPG